MSKTYTWRPSGGYYYNTSGTTVAADDNYYYSSNRAFRMDFSELPMEKSTLQIRQAVLNVHIVTAYSATLTIGYSYNTAWSNRKTLLTSKTGIVMGTKTGSKAIDLTEVIQAYCRDGQSGTLRLWAFGTGGSTSLSRIRGYNPSSSYQSQRPYFTLTYDDSKARVFTDGEWKSAVPYIVASKISDPYGLKLTTSGRTNVRFPSFIGDTVSGAYIRTSSTQNTSTSSLNRYYRAYINYTDLDGNTQYLYSDPIKASYNTAASIS